VINTDRRKLRKKSTAANNYRATNLQHFLHQSLGFISCGFKVISALQPESQPSCITRNPTVLQKYIKHNLTSCAQNM